jgi:phosphatidylinositol alpha 1,6-mannosyltransferase
VFLMRRGVEADRFSPLHRRRASGPFRIGYVGRLTPEKNVRFLAQLSRAIAARGHGNFEFVIVGQGLEEQWLRENVLNSTLAGVLRGVPLAEAYADMDLFVFPSSTDTFGNVILEALASGVPAVVTSGGGPKFLVRHGVTGFIAADDDQFIDRVCGLMENPDLHARMKEAARTYAVSMSWDSVFENVFAAYTYCVNQTAQPARAVSAGPVTA